MRYFRPFMFLVCAVQAFFALAFALRLPIAEAIWPLSYTNDMSFLFIGSIFAAAAASTFWVFASREYGALAGIALDYVLIFIPLTLFMFQADAGRGGPMRNFGISTALGAVVGVALFIWSVRIPIRDPRPLPGVVRAMFAFFVIVLIFVGGALVLKTPNILPWTINAAGSVVYGWMFLGAAAYFSYSLLRPSWHNAVGQLLGFLAYDLVLIVPFLLLLPEVRPAWLPNLILYTLVVAGSGLLAAYYLFVNPATRLTGARALMQRA